MNKTSKCKECGRSAAETHIEPGRRECTACRTQRRQMSTSLSYEAFLQNIYVNARSKVRNKKRTREYVFSIEAADLTDLWVAQKGRCALSGVFLTHHKDGSGTKDFNASLDRISNHKDYTLDNIQLVAYRINLMKHTLSEDMFYWWVKTISDSSCD